jgi:hypothetical protein
MHFIAASVRQTGCARESVTVVRGVMEHDGFDLEPALAVDWRDDRKESAAGLAAHADAMARETANCFQGARGVSNYDGGTVARHESRWISVTG